VPPDHVERAPSGWLHWRLPAPVVLVLWAVVGSLALVAVMRLVAWDRFEPFAVLDTVTLFVFLPAWPIALVAAFGRRPVLAGCAVLVTIVQVVSVMPEFTAAQPVPAWATTTPTFRLLDANVFSDNRSMAGYVHQIRATHPDVVTLEEAGRDDVTQLRKGGALAGLPFQFDVPGTGPFVFFIASRYRLSGSKVVYFHENALIVETVLTLPSGPQPLWVVHTIAPLPVSFDQWKGQLTEIHRLLAARGTGHLLVVGDFNSTWGNKGFRQILDTGLVDAGAARGQPLAMTWSQTMALLPPVVRIDHLLTGSGVAVVGIRTEAGPGSDHRDLVAMVASRSGTSVSTGT